MSGTRVEVRISDTEGVDEVEVIEVLVKVGDTVAQGDPVLEVATDKANLEVDAPVAGVIAELLVADGDIIDPNGILAWIAAS